ncbi:DUF3027 domain-containing protein [Arthrobacter sp. B0490]|uniref:DUF3027 domain-containing protein n=1 Tax=Arthrobacter sp. B0490 TaxID=2058891 RepID=UPI000CE47B97|nr:DUF3027 domain-containing protein [Arthrobacter sp. B0490]
MTSSNLETADAAAPIDAATTSAGADAAPAGTARKPRASRRIPKSDVVLEAAVDRARLGILEVAPEAQVGSHVSAVVEGERLVTHRFEAFVPGYGGWHWYASVARVARSKDVTVCEVGLLPSSTSLLAPEWLPWSERVRPEDSPADEPATAASPADAPDDQAVPAASPADAPDDQAVPAASPADEPATAASPADAPDDQAVPAASPADEPATSAPTVDARDGRAAAAADSGGQEATDDTAEATDAG